eukprot:g22148.t1
MGAMKRVLADEGDIIHSKNDAQSATEKDKNKVAVRILPDKSLSILHGNILLLFTGMSEPTLKRARLDEAEGKALQPWLTKSRKTMLKVGSRLEVQEHAVEGEGHSIADWLWLEMPHYVNVAAVSVEGKWRVLRQTKYAVGVVYNTDTLATIGGYVGKGEDPLKAAQRELREETGYVSDSWFPLMSGVVDANRGCGVGHFFLAMDCKMGPPMEDGEDDLEQQIHLDLSSEDLESQLLTGRFKHISWACALSMALLLFRKQQALRAAAAAASPT